jgi:bifunctional non-homologous end joining protein LigD
MQLCCPIAAGQSADEVSGYAKRIAEELEKMIPASITSRMAKNLRPGKIFIDWSQNNAAKTTVAPYSLRAQPSPTASTPLTWEEVESIAIGETPPHQFSPAEVLDRVEEHGDLLEPLLILGPAVPSR